MTIDARSPASHPSPARSAPVIATLVTATLLMLVPVVIPAQAAAQETGAEPRPSPAAPSGDSVAAVTTGGSRTAPDPALEERVREIAASLRCPVCLGLSVEDSPSQLARDMKDFIRKRLREGAEPEEIRQHFVDLYGEWVLMTPEPEGLNLALWIVPVLAVLGGIVLVGAVVRRWTEEPAANG